MLSCCYTPQWEHCDCLLIHGRCWFTFSSSSKLASALKYGSNSFQRRILLPFIPRFGWFRHVCMFVRRQGSSRVIFFFFLLKQMLR